MPSSHAAHCRRQRQGGFTLVELSIVLVIVGLLIGGILVGRDMIRSSEIFSLGKDATAYTAAVNVFRLRYNAIPGDMRTATDVWGVSSGGCPNGTGSGTCNGNGDRLLTDSIDNEMHRFWQHLALAGLIPGQYTGIGAGGDPVHVVIGLNGPATRLQGVGFTAVNMGINSPTAPYLFPGDYSQNFQIGRETLYQTEAPFLLPTEALLLDTKYDDALPASGRYVMRNNIAIGGNPNCTNANASQAATAAYVTTYKDIACGLIIRDAW